MTLEINVIMWEHGFSCMEILTLYIYCCYQVTLAPDHHLHKEAAIISTVSGNSWWMLLSKQVRCYHAVQHIPTLTNTQHPTGNYCECSPKQQSHSNISPEHLKFIHHCYSDISGLRLKPPVDTWKCMWSRLGFLGNTSRMIMNRKLNCLIYNTDDI